MTRELRLRCTEAMLLSLDREHRIAYVLGDIFNLSGDEAAQVLDKDAAAFRKRLSAGQTLVVRGGTSVLGQAAINIAKDLDARVLATSRSREWS